MKQLLLQLTPMRAALLAAALLTLVVRPLAEAGADYSGWRFLPNLFTPVMVPMLVMVLCLDALMATVWKSQSSGDELRRYRMIQRADLAVVALLVAVWISFYAALGG
jgi:hypothetical protein